MTLVERFIEINRWSTSRKSVLLTGLLAVGTVLNWLFTHIALDNNKIVNVALLDRIYAGGTFVFVLSFAVSWISARHGQYGRWIPYATVVLFGVYGACLIREKPA